MVSHPFLCGFLFIPRPVRPILQILSQSRRRIRLRDAFWRFWSKMDPFFVNLEGFLASEMGNGFFKKYAPQTGIALCNFYWKPNGILILLETFWTLFEWAPMGLNLDA